MNSLASFEETGETMRLENSEGKRHLSSHSLS
jgi:hypothetical protein